MSHQKTLSLTTFTSTSSSLYFPRPLALLTKLSLERYHCVKWLPMFVTWSRYKGGWGKGSGIKVAGRRGETVLLTRSYFIARSLLIGSDCCHTKVRGT